MLAHDEGLAQYLTVQLIPTHGIQWGTMPLLEAVARGSAHSDRPMHVQSHRHWGFDATFMPHQL